MPNDVPTSPGMSVGSDVDDLTLGGGVIETHHFRSHTSAVQDRDRDVL